MAKLIQSKYQQYKRDTISLASWLAQAAVQHGYPLSEFAAGAAIPVAAPPSRSAKKKTKQKIKAGKAVPPAGPAKSVTMTVRQFTEVARHLVNGSVDIPIEVMQLLKRCISLRYRCLKRFLDAPDASTPGHAYFIRVLEEVYDMFEHHRSKPTAATSAVGSDQSARALPTPPPSAVSSTPISSNRFAELALLTEEEEDLPDIQLPPSAPDAPLISCAPEPTEEENLFAILAYLQDVHSVRDAIKALWVRFRRNQVDLITAAVTSNTALELLRGPYDELAKTMGPRPLAEKLATLYNFQLFDLTGFIEAPPLFTQIVDEDLRCDLYDHLLLPALSCMESLVRVMRNLGKQTIPSCKVDHYGRLDLEPVGTRQRWKQTMIIITEILPDYFSLMDIPAPSAPVVGNDMPTWHPYFVDELAREFRDFYESQEVTLLVVVFAQIFVDIVLAAGPSVNRGSQQLQRGAAAMRTSLEARKQVEAVPPVEMWPDGNEQLCEMFQAELDYWARLVPLLIKDDSMPFDPDGRKRKSKLFDCSPMLCGVMLFRLRLKYQHFGLILTNSWASILSAAHLLAACRHSGCYPGRTIDWPDMDLILDLHGRDDIFGGKYPENCEDSHVSYLHMVGLSKEVQQFAQSPFTTELPSASQFRSPNGPHGLKDHTQILPIFLSKYCRDPSSGTHIDIHSLEALLTTLKTSNKTVRRKRKHRSPQFSILQLLSILEAGLEAETKSVRFDYVLMHLRCLRLLEKVRLGAHDYLLSKIGPKYLPDEALVSLIVGWILHVADMSAKSAAHVGLNLKGGTVARSKLLFGATSAVRQFLLETGEGSAEIAKMAE